MNTAKETGWLGRVIRLVLWFGLFLAVVAGLVAMAAALTAPEWMGDVNVVIDNERFDLNALSQSQLFCIGLALALVLLVVVPLSLMLGLGIPLLMVVTALVVVTSLLLLVLSPALAVAALLWWLFKPRPAAPPTIGA